MRILIHILSVLLMLGGIAAFTLPIAVFGSPGELSMLSATFACVVLVVGSCFIATGFQHVRKKNKQTALVVATTSGFLAWILLNSQAMQFAESKEDDTWRFGALVLPVLICYYGTKALKRVIAEKYQG